MVASSGDPAADARITHYDIPALHAGDRTLTVRPLTPAEIRALREREGASQAVFARYLNVTAGLVSQWERGEKHPQGASLKLLSLVAKSGLGTVA
jgi:DNA-binding transcriptional regulator YiaG